MLELLKELLGYPAVTDAILNIYLSRAEKGIKYYLNRSTWTEEQTIEYGDEIVLYAKYLYETEDEIGLASESEGGRSVTYDVNNKGIPKEIKASLPTPYIRVLG